MCFFEFCSVSSKSWKGDWRLPCVWKAIGSPGFAGIHENMEVRGQPSCMCHPGHECPELNLRLLHDFLRMVRVLVMDGLGQDTRKLKVLVIDPIYVTSAIRKAGIKTRTLCRTGRVAWAKENFSGWAVLYHIRAFWSELTRFFYSTSLESFA